MSGISNHYDTLAAIKSIIDGLSLAGLTGGTVIQEVANAMKGNCPATPFVSLSPFGPESVADELNDRDGTYYGVLVAIIAQPSIESLEQRLGWRQSIRRHLNNVSLGSISGNYNLMVEPKAVIDPKVWLDQNLFVSGFVVRAYFQEPRS